MIYNYFIFTIWDGIVDEVLILLQVFSNGDIKKFLYTPVVW